MKSKFSKKIFEKYFKDCLSVTADGLNLLEEDESQFWHTVYLKDATIHISEYDNECISNMYYNVNGPYESSEIYATSSKDPIELLKKNKRKYFDYMFPNEMRKLKLNRIIK